MQQERTKVVNSTVILNEERPAGYLQRLPLLNSMRGRSRIQYGMTALLNNGGFTLIELLVVVLIIGILAAVAVPQYNKAVEKSRLAQARVMLETIYKARDLCYLQYGQNNEKECGIVDYENRETNNLLLNMDIELPGEILYGVENCISNGGSSEAVCVQTKDWEFGSNEAGLWYAARIKNGEVAYSLEGKLQQCWNGTETFCTSLCGSNGCTLN